MIEKLILVASENYNVKGVFNTEKEISGKKKLIFAFLPVWCWSQARD